MRWRSRSVSTRVLPDPAGAMIRAGPDPWATAASWSGARSAAGATGEGDGPDVARLDRLGGGRRPHRRRARRRRRPADRRRPTAGVPSGSTTSAAPAVAGPSGHGAGLDGLAAPPPDRLVPAAGVVGVGPHQEVQPVMGRVEVGRQGRRIVPDPVGPQRPRGAELGRVDPEGDDHGGARGPVVVQCVHHLGPVARRRRRSRPARPGRSSPPAHRPTPRARDRPR